MLGGAAAGSTGGGSTAAAPFLPGLPPAEAGGGPEGAVASGSVKWVGGERGVRGVRGCEEGCESLC